MPIGNKMSALGERGRTKYEHCTTVDEMKKVKENYQDDLFGDEWNYNLPLLKNATSLFYNNKKIKKFNADISSLTNGQTMFYNSTLEEFSLPLDSLTSGYYMFRGTKLHTFHTTNLNNLTNAQSMFYGVFLNIDTWTYDLPNVTNGEWGFPGGNLKIKQWKGNLNKLSNGYNMFNNQQTLFSFESDLPQLSRADGFMSGTILNKQSALRVLTTIPKYTSGTHNLTIGIHIDNQFDEDIIAAINSANDNGWNVTNQWNGNGTKDEIINPAIKEKLQTDLIQLPEGYVRCEYLESNENNQFIDTGIIPTNDIGSWIVAKRITESIDGLAMAVRTDSNYYYTPTVRSNITFHGWGATTQWDDIAKQNTIFESYINYPIDGIVVKDAVAIINKGTSYSKSLTIDLPSISHKIYLFGRNYNGTLEKPWNGLIYRAKISEGTEIIRDFIPCLDTDGKPCMYDLIEGKPYYNKGTGEDFAYKVLDD